jgi:hypothetical protein
MQGWFNHQNQSMQSIKGKRKMIIWIHAEKAFENMQHSSGF